MDRVMKISCNQSGALTGTKNLVDFDIPNMAFDLSKSYIAVHSSVTTDDLHTAPATGTSASADYPQFSGGVGVYNCMLNYNDGTSVNRHYANKHLVRNVSMYSQNAGMVEDIRRSDVLQFNMDNYTKDLDQKINASSVEVSSLFSADAKTGIRWSPHRRMEGEGTDKSENLDREIRINLKDVMKSCDNIWDGQKYGNTRIHAELSLAQLAVLQTLTKADGIWAGTDGGADATEKIARSKVLADTDNVPKTTLTMERVYKNAEASSPFYVGQKITCSGTIGTDDFTAGANHRVRVITGIAIAAEGVGERITLTLDKALGTGAIATNGAVDVSGCDAVTPAVVFETAELVLYATDRSPPPQLAFKTYKTEEDNFTGSGNNYNHQYYLESEVQNVFWGSRASDKVLGMEQVVNSYRIRESGKDKTDRDVVYGSSLHKNRIQRAFNNSGMAVKDFGEAVLTNTARRSQIISDNGTSMKIPCFMIAETTDIAEQPKLLDVNIVANNGFSQISLFKEVVKVM